jgi:hypothetical protein
MRNTETPCGCAFHRGASASVPPDCLHRTPAERAAYVAIWTVSGDAGGSITLPPHTGTRHLDDGFDAARAAGLSGRLTITESRRPIHAYANGGRP